MSKNRRYIYSFVITLLILGCLWIYNQKNNEVRSLKTDLDEANQKLEEVKAEMQACKGELFHRQKLLDMERAKVNRIKQDTLVSYSL